MTFTVKAAVDFAGRVSTGNSKMPGSSFALSATKCNVGSKLAAVKDSTCSRCYALKLERLRPSVHQGWMANYLKATTAIANDPAAWARAAAFQINRIVAGGGEPYHRWFDSGDLASVEMLKAICLAAELTPAVRHWLPTREAAIVKAFHKAGGTIPANLIIRVSATMIGDGPTAGHSVTSTVSRKGAAHVGHLCPAPHQGNSCGSCRACWSRDVPNVSYGLH